MTDTHTGGAAPTPGAPSPSEAPQATASTPADHVVSSAMLVFGITGSGKTSLLITLMEYVWEVYRKVSLLYITDGGGIHPHLQALINRGIVRIWKMRTRSGARLAFETCQRASQGWWPERINPRTGEVSPTVRLVPPVTTAYQVRCPAGHLVKTARTPKGATDPTPCPTCKVLVNGQNAQVTMTEVRTKGFEQVGAVFYDGLSSQGTWMMDDLGERAGKNELGGEKGNLNTVVSGDVAFGATNRGAYGMVQTRLEQMVLNSNSIPGLVIPPTWTALTLELSDEGGLPIKGPLVIGQAKTATIGEKFGDTLEAIVLERERKKYRRLCLQQWIDDKGARHLCQVRSYPGLMPAFLEDEEVGQGTETTPGETQPFVNFSLRKFYVLREAAKALAEARFTEQYADAPGLPDGEMEYGEGTPAPATPVAPAPAPARAVPPAQLAKPAAPAAPATPTARPATATAAPPAPAAPPARPTPPRVAQPVAPTTTPPAPAAVPPARPVNPAAPAQAVAAPKPPARSPLAPPPGRPPAPPATPVKP